MAKLNDPYKIGSMEVKNRLYRAPVLEGAATKESAADEYLHAFEPNARAGVGLIIQGNTVVMKDGNTAPGMLAVEDKETILLLEKMTKRLHEYGTKIVMQIGHGGIFALPSWSKKARRDSTNPILTPSPLPFPLNFMHPGAHVMTTDEVCELAERFGEVASWAREAGYDGVQLASSNAKLLHQFLTPVYNRRDDEFGGTLEKRFRFISLIREKIAEKAGGDFPVLVKIPMMDHKKGISLDDGIKLCRLAEKTGFSSITPVIASHHPSTNICRGDFPAESYKNPNIVKAYMDHTESKLMYHLIRVSNRHYSNKYPFAPVWNREIFRRAKEAVNVPVFAVGGIRSLDEIDEILGNNHADMLGIGRPFYAEPELPARLLKGDRRKTLCESCNRCIPSQMLGLRGTCYNPNVQMKKTKFMREEQKQENKMSA